ncbi:D-alanyl-D-alanine carboxypeptidase family protein [Bacillus solitudinis]|uniref:D-alanyl-D-alanine carboxypeptidase family protein n=1 Tax=Bacillus solitudinis TaxID=2014074 RepID=UPI000C2487D3|nr:D-alanyl-D-alanine carboxypeptidase family protein [Bacillus solitudinis]
MIRKFTLFILVILLITTALPSEGIAEQRNFSVSAQAAVLIEKESGRVLYGKNEHQPLRIASITKIMTAILAVESGKVDELVTVSKRAAGTEGSSIYLRENEKIKLEDLVYGLMLRSGNDSAVAIAEHVGGSLEGFVYMMNEKAEELGMTKTMFQNPHGLDDHEEHYSTAYDMALLTKYAMNNEHYKEITSTKTHRVEGEQIRVWKNKNRLLTELYKYSTGGKTGYTKRANRTLVSTAQKDDMDLIVVTLNAPSDWHDHMNLCNWAFNTFEVDTLIKEGTFREIKDAFYKDRIFAPYSFEYPLTNAEREMVKKEISLYRPPTERKGQFIPPQPVGKVKLTLADKTIAEIPLYYEAPEIAEKKSFWSRFLDIFSLTIGVKPVDK